MFILINIFIPNTPLHDGAVIISGENILAASCFFTLTDNKAIFMELGTRHRAGLWHFGKIRLYSGRRLCKKQAGVSVMEKGRLQRNVSLILKRLYFKIFLYFMIK